MLISASLHKHLINLSSVPLTWDMLGFSLSILWYFPGFNGLGCHINDTIFLHLFISLHKETNLHLSAGDIIERQRLCYAYKQLNIMVLKKVLFKT